MKCQNKILWFYFQDNEEIKQIKLWGQTLNVAKNTGASWGGDMEN